MRTAPHPRTDIRSKLAVVLVALLALTATTLPSASPATAQTDEHVPYTSLAADEHITSRIDIERSLDDLRHLTTVIGPRLGGTPAENEAAAFLAAELERYGYDVQLQPFAASNKAVGHVYLTGGPQPYGPTLQTGRATNGVLTGDDRVSGPLVDAGTGMTADQFPDDVAGAIVVMENATSNAQRNVQVANAVERGAAAAILRRPQQTPFDPTLTTPSPIPVLGVGAGQGAHLRDRADAGDVVSVDTATLTGLTSYNVFASKPATHPLPSEDEPRIAMISAHYDTVRGSPGANDDGSGTILTLELARVLADLPTSQEVRFAFWGAEEQGLIGSRYYVDTADDAELDRFIGLWQNDMVATTWEPANRYNLLAVDGQHNTVTLSVEAAAARLGLDGFVIGPIVRGGSDHVPFHNRGIAAANHSWRPASGPGNLEPQYHTPEDTIETNISPQRWEISMSLIGTAVYDQVRPSFASAHAELDVLVAAGGITPARARFVTSTLELAESWLENPVRRQAALAQLQRAALRLDAYASTGQDDAEFLRGLAALIRGLDEILR